MVLLAKEGNEELNMLGHSTNVFGGGFEYHIKNMDDLRVLLNNVHERKTQEWNIHLDKQYESIIRNNFKKELLK